MFVRILHTITNIGKITNKTIIVTISRGKEIYTLGTKCTCHEIWCGYIIGIGLEAYNTSIKNN